MLRCNRNIARRDHSRCRRACQSGSGSRRRKPGNGPGVRRSVRSLYDSVRVPVCGGSGAAAVVVPGGASRSPPDLTITPNADLNYFELKAGVSGELIKNLTAGATVYYAWDYFAETGSVWTVEGTLAYTLPAIGPVTPTISGLVGYQDGDDAEYAFFNGFDSYTYYNVGLALAIDKLTLDFRYWGTSDAENVLSKAAGASCANNYCDDRFVFTAKVTLP